MPIYDYRCEECQCTFEAVRKLSENSSTVPCQKCDGLAKKQISAPNLASAGSHGDADHVPKCSVEYCGDIDI